MESVLKMSFIQWLYAINRQQINRNGQYKFTPFTDMDLEILGIVKKRITLKEPNTEGYLKECLFQYEQENLKTK